MKTFISTALLLLSIPAGAANKPAELAIPLEINYSLIKKALLTQVYKGESNSVEVWNSGQGCSFLKLSNPNISGKDGEIRLLNEVHARYGTKLGSQCLPVLNWTGVLETFQKPTLDASQAVVSFPVTKTGAYDREGHYLQIEKLQDLIKHFAEPKLAEIKLDLNESRDDIADVLDQIVPEANKAQAKTMLNSLHFSSVEAGAQSINVKLVMNAPKNLVHSKPKPAPAFTEAEQAQWQEEWKHWDAFLASAVKQAQEDTESAELREALVQILADSRTSLQAGLQARDVDSVDPVRAFFTKTWERLSPVLKSIANDVSGMQGLRYMSFIAATDAIYQLENIGAPFGVEISSDGLRRLVRVLLAKKQNQGSAEQTVVQ